MFIIFSLINPLVEEVIVFIKPTRGEQDHELFFYFYGEDDGGFYVGIHVPFAAVVEDGGVIFLIFPRELAVVPPFLTQCEHFF